MMGRGEAVRARGARPGREALPFRDEAELQAAWGRGPAGPLRLADGRTARVVFPGVPGDGTGPDFRGAIVEVEGDLLRGDVELHLRHSGWFAHGHDRDPAYAGVALHVVAGNDLPLRATPHRGVRRVPLLVFAPAPAGTPAAFVPPCAFARAAGLDVEATLARMGVRRLRMKANRAALLAAARGPGTALFALAAEALLGPAHRALARAVQEQPGLGGLLEAGAGYGGEERALAMTAALRAAAGPLRAGGRVRPAAAPAARLGALGALAARWWPRGSDGGWPALLTPGAGWQAARAPGIGRGAAIEVAANAVIPAALGTGAWPEEAALEAWAALPSPGTYGKLRPLERWLGGLDSRPFGSAGRLQGGLLLQADYCEKGACGRCPLSPPA
ncbi:DUF2851 family protein [Tepidiforma bonchosmolovskayae]|uniref:DUF2851 family protein n=1 Tax=Tepidiforma bonchosmolovskayae TaxID=2601677 RepID=A0ABX6C0L9_9CHLR|nr:DUF2851 family protein [Tepidiforma bonchosmolovskayae]QFG02633.1 DUF2851 family protein [Tepidiforma bonchosmolovskayae]